ncbi:MAG TPA: leucyl aminopeptidase, partial [Terricaulis sp.]|nr:leucyl aminopeptidase [Terricaulis sp.]
AQTRPVITQPAAQQQRAISFAAAPGEAGGALVLPLSTAGDLDTRGASLSEDERAAITRALTSADFKYGARATLSLRGIGAWDRILIVGLGETPSAL